MSKRKKSTPARHKTPITQTHTIAEALQIGIQYHEAGDLYQAEVIYREILAKQPNHSDALHLLGVIAAQVERYSIASELISRAISITNTVPNFYNSLGNALRGQGKLSEAIVQYRQALSIDPTYATAQSNILVTLNCVSDCDRATIFAEHRHFNELQAQPLAASIQPHTNDRTVTRRLKIGYVSPDFYQHSVAYFIEPVLAHHDADQFEVFGYYNNIKNDPTTKRLQCAVAHWFPCASLTDEALAEKIRQDGIDILVDLTGHNNKNRLLVFARKPAPVQVSYLGYSNTTGLTTIDYRLTDNWVEPVGAADELSSEKLVRLPDSYFCYQPPQESPAVNTLPALKNGYITFGSFNNHGKISPDILAVWVSILQTLPTAKLLVKSKSLYDAPTRQALRRYFTECGIESGRLIVADYTVTTEAHLSMYHQVDIALDTYPYNGATTTCEALWMGVPVVTLSGDKHISRMGLSILSTVKLGELIAKTTTEYVDICVKLANDTALLQKVREGLREDMQESPLLDVATFTRHIEAAYREMWTTWCHRSDGVA